MAIRRCFKPAGNHNVCAYGINVGLGTVNTQLGCKTVSVTAGTYAALSPSRALDTRAANGAPAASVGPGGTVHLQVLGRGGVPASGVSAVVLNVTVTGPTGPGFITAYPDGTAMPTASNLNFVAGQTVSNLVVVPVGADGKVALTNGSTGTVQLLADVSGYFSG